MRLKKLAYLLLVFTFSFITLLANAQVLRSKNFYCGGYNNDCYDLNPPPASALRMTEKAMNASSLKLVRPKEWKVRAIVGYEVGDFEFDQQGNVINVNGEPATGYLVEVLQQNNQPLWKGRDRVYYWYQPEKGDVVDNYSDNQSLLIGENGVFIVSDKRVCPASKIAEEHTEFNIGRSEHYLDGNCSKAIVASVNRIAKEYGKKVKKVDNQVFLTYPTREKNFSPKYWKIQYFNEPITPIYDVDGECWLYCEK
ncbi:hypothetical protein MTZ49_15740 (plasmid) [Entomomonas sp. E2T0]|uniref:hypothetical protein n=1 Tax=Entomomonas sp. E2T0 TaxID=2930213 RepID=UPI0022280ED1|nr:hypothetical protein [Entomomonas sp. E2T0]UYZ85594.1 hypothetical protein MTZ49_15740 [Entomomonas sp. E2T0]